MFPRTLTIAVATAAALISGICYADPKKDSEPGPDQSIVQQGFAASPIPKEQLNLAGKNPDLVGLGSYLVNTVADCNGCHALPKFLTTGAGDPYLGRPGDQSLTNSPVKANINVAHFLAGGRCFGPPPSIISFNITPEPGMGNLPAGLTEDEFIRMMRTGKDITCDEKHDPQNAVFCTHTDPPGTNPYVLQTMPWPTFHNMTDRDLKAVYAYLSAVPHAEPCNTTCPASYAPTPDGTCPFPPPPQ
jgi:hypothetical protein